MDMSQRELVEFDLRFLLYRSEDDPRKFVAHCLELDVVAVASTRPKALVL